MSAMAPLEEDSKSVPTLIKTYGEFWNPELVDWKNTRRLMGRPIASKKAADVNLYVERGVYVLYNKFVPVYVGKADKQSIGYRIQSHRESRRKGPRWDSFSWFGICGLNSKREVQTPKLKQVSVTQFIATLEALLIVAIDPRLNSRREKLQNAEHFAQSSVDQPPDVEARLQSIEEKLDALLKG